MEKTSRNKKGQFIKGMTYRMSKGHKRKIAESHKGKKRPPFSKEWRENISESLKGNKRNWKGGRTKHKGRWYIRKSNHPFSWSNGYILQSHLLMEKKIGRYLKSKEVVHHINGIKDDDRPENLYLMRDLSMHQNYEINLRRSREKL